MDYTHIFSIGAAGMGLERLRLETAALNLANANNRMGDAGQAYRARKVVVEALPSQDFASAMADEGFGGVQRHVAVVESSEAPRAIHEPDNPLADANGFVYAAAVNPVEEMLTVMTAVRSFEANVKVLETARGMLLKALDIGSGR